ncbi:unnamed protein product [Schistocephalus solidus]|uniref:Nuclear transport factor 2 family protein n=1 Tax=Schistocephalus solidus TaxID=70667 RepID=A0A183ST95_SCHSO|nr:unnamed protein product [Schistocephalus solidus]
MYGPARRRLVWKAGEFSSYLYLTLTCGSSKLGSSQRPTPGKRHDRRAKPLLCASPHPQRLREIQDASMARKAEEIQVYADSNEWKNLAATKCVYEPPTKEDAHVFSAKGNTLLTEKAQILKGWAEHFLSFLNQPYTLSNAAIDRWFEVETNADLYLLFSLSETIRGSSLLNNVEKIFVRIFLNRPFSYEREYQYQQQDSAAPDLSCPH